MAKRETRVLRARTVWQWALTSSSDASSAEFRIR
jgi:hypothetical protein